MTGEQAVHSFWASFDIPAYDETSVPDQLAFPYITHEGAVDTFGYEIAQTASIFSRSTSWAEAVSLRRQIEGKLPKGGKILPYDGGAVLMRRGDPWAQRLADTNDDWVRRIALNYTIEYIE